MKRRRHVVLSSICLSAAAAMTLFAMTTGAIAEAEYDVAIQQELSPYRLSVLTTLAADVDYDSSNHVANCKASENQLREMAKKGFYIAEANLVPGSALATNSAVRQLASSFPVDTDGDGMDDDWEVTNFGDLSHDGTQDLDAVGPASSPGHPLPGSDGVTDLWEYRWGTNPNHWDTDGDNVSDGDEITALRAGDHGHGPPFIGWPSSDKDRDGDCIPDLVEELLLGLNSNRESTDGDKYDDGQEFFGITEIGRGGMPRSVDSDYLSSSMPNWVDPPGNHWFIAAYPDLRVSLQANTFTIIRRTSLSSGEKHIEETENTYSCTSERVSESSRTDIRSRVDPPTTLATATDPSQPFQIVASTNAVPSVNGGPFSQSGSFNNICTPNYPIPEELEMLLAVFQNEDDFADLRFVLDQARSSPKTHLETLVDELGDLVPFNALGIGAEIASIEDDLLDWAFDKSPVNEPAWLRNTTKYAMHGPGFVLMKGDSGDYAAHNIIRNVKSDAIGAWNQLLDINDSSSVHTSSRKYERIVTTTTSRYFTRDEWEHAEAKDTHHAADLRFNLRIRNEGTDVCRQITKILVNAYIGTSDASAHSVSVLGDTGWGTIDNLFPGQEVVFTSPVDVPLTLDELRRIDSGQEVTLVIERVEYGDDQVFYEDAYAGGVLFEVDDGVTDGEEEVDRYLIPTWGQESYMDVLLRASPIVTYETSASGHIGSLTTPQYNDQHRINMFNREPVSLRSRWVFLTQTSTSAPQEFRDIAAASESTVKLVYDTDSDGDAYSDRIELRQGTDPEAFSSHPAPRLVAGYVEDVSDGTNCTRQLVLANVGDWPAYGVQAQMFSETTNVFIRDNFVGGSGVLQAGQSVIIGPTLALNTSTWNGSAEPVAVGVYSGTSDVLYTFAADDSGNVGWTTNRLQISWTASDGKSGTIALGTNYVAPTSVLITNGLYLRFGSGSSNGAGNGYINAGDVFTVQAKTSRDVFRFSKDSATNSSPQIILSFNDQQGNWRQIVDYQMQALTDSLDYPEIISRPKTPAPFLTLSSLTDWSYGGTNQIYASIYNPGTPIQDAHLFVECVTSTGLVVRSVSFTNDIPVGRTLYAIPFTPSDFSNHLAQGDEVLTVATFTDSQGDVIDMATRSARAGVPPSSPARGGTLAISSGSLSTGTNALGNVVGSTIVLANTGTNVLEVALVATNPAVSTSLPGGTLQLRPGESATILVALDTRYLQIGTNSLGLTLVTSDPLASSSNVTISTVVTVPTNATFVVQDVPQYPWRKRVTFSANYTAGDQISFGHGLGDADYVHPMYIVDVNGQLIGVGEVMLPPGHTNYMARINPSSRDQVLISLPRTMSAGDSMTIIFAKGMTNAPFASNMVFNCSVAVSTQFLNEVSVKYAVADTPQFVLDEFDYTDANASEFYSNWYWPSGSLTVSFETNNIYVHDNGTENMDFFLRSQGDIPGGHRKLWTKMSLVGPGQVSVWYGTNELFYSGAGEYSDVFDISHLTANYIRYRQFRENAHQTSLWRYYYVFLDAIAGDPVRSYALNSRFKIVNQAAQPLVSMKMSGFLNGTASIPLDDLDFPSTNNVGVFDVPLGAQLDSSGLDMESYELQYMLLYDPQAHYESMLLPDYSISAVSVSGNGPQVVVTASILNSGQTNAPVTTVSFYVGDPSSSGQFVGSVLLTNAVGVHATNLVSFAWSPAVGVESNIVYAVVDPFNSVNELDEGNNSRSSVPELPDLFLPGVSLLSAMGGTNSAYDHPVRSTPVTVSVAVTNSGLASAGSVGVHLFDSIPTTSSTAIAMATTNIAAHSSCSVSLSWTPTNAGWYDLTAYVDWPKAIAESVETNNTFTRRVLVSMDMQYIDCGASSDVAYATSRGYGYLSGVPRTNWGVGGVSSAVETARYDLSGLVRYGFDNLDPFYSYQVDFSLYRGDAVTSGFELAIGSTSLPVHIYGGPVTNVVWLNSSNAFSAYGTVYVPADLILSNSVVVGSKRSGSAGPSYLSELQVAQGKRVFIDCGADDDLAYFTPGHTAGHISDGFAWSPSNATVVTSVRYDFDGDVRYRFTGLVETQKYLLRVILWEDDGVGRIQRILVDGGVVTDPIDMSDEVVHETASVLRTADTSDGQVDVTIERVNGWDAQVSALELDEWSLGPLVLKDSDQDGMPDSFEVSYAKSSVAGVNPLNLAEDDASQDNDGDGMSNLAEYMAGTDPLSAADKLSLSEVAAVGYGTEVTWQAKKFKRYSIEFTVKLASTTQWTTAVGEIQALQDGAMTWSDPSVEPGESRYYRVRVLSD